MHINIHTHHINHECELELLQVFKPEKHPLHASFSFGMLPEHLPLQENWIAWERIIASSSCLAVGECGLDKRIQINMLKQIDFFSKWVDLAIAYHKPLIIHCVKAFNDVINVLEDKHCRVPVIFHGFNNGLNTAELLLQKGYYLSFGKALLGFDSNASKCIRQTPKSQLLLETDDTDLSIKFIYNKAARLLGINEQALKDQIQKNIKSIFKSL